MLENNVPLELILSISSVCALGGLLCFICIASFHLEKDTRQGERSGDW